MWKGIYPVIIGGIFLSILLTSISPVSDSDIWWHLATGRYIIESGQIPKTDIFSHTVPGREWIDHEWLSQVAFYFMYHLFGFAGPVLLKSACLLVAFFFLFKRATLSSSRAATTLTLIAVIFVSKDAWLERPMIFTFMFASIFLFVLERKRPLWALPLLTLLWANLHGGFIIGILIIFLFAVGSALSGDFKGAKRLSLILFASVLSSLANPYTYKVLTYPFHYVSNITYSLFILEWQSPQFHTFSLYEALILLTFVALALKKGIHPTDMLLLLVFTHLSLFAVRNVSLYGLVCAPIIIGHLEDGVKTSISATIRLPKNIESAITARAIPAFIYTAVILSYVLFFGSYLTGAVSLDAGPSQRFPEGAVGFIHETKPQGQLYNQYGWGGYCIWTLYPEYRVFIDGRADVYGDFLYEYLKVHRVTESWDETLQKYNVSIVLIPTGSPLDVLLNESTSWERAYRDDIASVYLRSSSKGGHE